MIAWKDNQKNCLNAWFYAILKNGPKRIADMGLMNRAKINQNFSEDSI